MARPNSVTLPNQAKVEVLLGDRPLNLRDRLVSARIVHELDKISWAEVKIYDPNFQMAKLNPWDRVFTVRITYFGKPEAKHELTGNGRISGVEVPESSGMPIVTLVVTSLAYNLRENRVPDHLLESVRKLPGTRGPKNSPLIAVIDQIAGYHGLGPVDYGEDFQELLDFVGDHHPGIHWGEPHPEIPHREQMDDMAYLKALVNAVNQYVKSKIDEQKKRLVIVNDEGVTSNLEEKVPFGVKSETGTVGALAGGPQSRKRGDTIADLANPILPPDDPAIAEHAEDLEQYVVGVSTATGKLFFKKKKYLAPKIVPVLQFGHGNRALLKFNASVRKPEAAGGIIASFFNDILNKGEGVAVATSPEGRSMIQTILNLVRNAPPGSEVQALVNSEGAPAVKRLVDIGRRDRTSVKMEISDLAYAIRSDIEISGESFFIPFLTVGFWVFTDIVSITHGNATGPGVASQQKEESGLAAVLSVLGGLFGGGEEEELKDDILSYSRLYRLTRVAHKVDSTGAARTEFTGVGQTVDDWKELLKQVRTTDLLEKPISYKDRTLWGRMGEMMQGLADFVMGM